MSRLDGSTVADAAAATFAHAAQSVEVAGLTDEHLHVHGESSFVEAVDAVRSALILEDFDFLPPFDTSLSRTAELAFRLDPAELVGGGVAMLVIGFTNGSARGFDELIASGDGVGDTIADDFVFTSSISLGLDTHGCTTFLPARMRLSVKKFRSGTSSQTASIDFLLNARLDTDLFACKTSIFADLHSEMNRWATAESFHLVGSMNAGAYTAAG